MKENSFDSALSPYIQGLLDQKRALGFKYITEEHILRSFDRYWCEKNGRMAVCYIVFGYECVLPGCTSLGRSG